MANYGTILVVDDNTSIFTTLEICLDGVFDRILTPHKTWGHTDNTAAGEHRCHTARDITSHSSWDSASNRQWDYNVGDRGWGRELPDTITAPGRTWMMSVIAIIPNDVNDWFRPMTNTSTSIFVCYCHRLWFNAPPHSVLIIRPFSASERPIKYHWAAQ